MINSLIFDFDGLILDTETPEFRVWQAIYHEHGHELPAEEWSKIIGGYGISDFDAAEHLAQLTGGGMEAGLLRARHRTESDALTLSQPVMPGVVELIEQAKSHRLSLAIASSSPHAWVDSHLSRLGMSGLFEQVICADDVPPGRTKPNPDLYQKALEALHIPAARAIAFEDSHNGVRAAKGAEIFVVAVPNQITSFLGVDGADLTLESLEDFRLAEYLDRH